MIMTHKSLFCLPILLSLSLSCREPTDEKSRSVLSGDWVSSCFPNTELHPSSIVSYSFDDEHGVVRTQDLYTDLACQNLAGRLTHSGEYSLEVRREISLFNVDIEFTKVVATVETNDGLQLWNDQKFCAVEDWQSESTRDLTATAETGCMTYGTAKVEYRDLVEVDGENQIIFGASLSPLIPRPSGIEAGRADRIFKGKLP
ncbi:MAG: hypothetical protein EOP07_11225 [Proteobacteria bacterium]|nr:MAG: hypothetical protein EOP07_11225 [Pseudomonadota bacterium]